MKLRIKEICQMRNTTQKELADKLGVSEVTHLCHYLKI